MKRLGSLLVVLFVLVAVTAVEAKREGKKPRQKPDFRGVVTAFDAETGALTLKMGRKKEVTVTVGADTTIKMGRKDATTDDLQEGVRVFGMYTTDENGEKTTTAAMLRILPARKGQGARIKPHPQPEPEEGAEEDGEM